MFLLIATIIFASFIAFFAIQNAGPVDLHMSAFSLTNIPLYWVILGSVLLTLIFSWVMLIIDSISSSFALHGSNNAVKQLKKENESLVKKVHQLEIESARGQGKQ
jgi:uncharacterized integral membrane protein